MSMNYRWYAKHAFSLQAVDVIRKSGLDSSPGIPGVDGYEVCLLEETDIPELMDFHDSRCVQWSNVFTREEVGIRLASGHSCFCVWCREDLVGFVWFAPRTIFSPDLHCRFDMEDRGVMIYNGFVAPEHRGRNVFPLLMNESFRALARLGYTRVYGFVRHRNFPSKRALAKHRFQTFGIVLYGFVMGCYFFLPFVRQAAGVRVYPCASPWHRWQEFFHKRLVREEPVR